jgi:DNA-binding MarR family transcriptional regulator
MPAKTSETTRVEFDAAWDEFLGAIRRARGRAAAEADAEGLSLAQFQLLYSFLDADAGDAVPVGTLAASAGIAQPTATRTLDALEREGVVERQPSTEDRRSVVVSLTKRGRKLLDRKRKLVAAKRAAVYESLDADDREHAASVLRALANAIEGDQ